MPLLGLIQPDVVTCPLSRRQSPNFSHRSCGMALYSVPRKTESMSHVSENTDPPDLFESRPLAAIVLCGGQSLRMESDKAWLSIGGETFLNRICRILGNITERVLVVAAVNQPLPELAPAVQIVRDEFPGEGPLGGLLTGLNRLEQANDDLRGNCPVWVSSCDAPFCHPGIIRHLLSRAGSSDAVLVRDDHGIHPFSGIYQSRVRSVAATLFESGVRAMGALRQQIDTAIINADDLRDIDPDLGFLCSANTPAELAHLHQLYNGMTTVQ